MLGFGSSLLYFEPAEPPNGIKRRAKNPARRGSGTQLQINFALSPVYLPEPSAKPPASASISVPVETKMPDGEREQLLASLFSAHYTRLRNYAKGLCGNWDDAEDMVMETYARVAAKVETVEPKALPAYWQRAIDNRWKDILRHKGLVTVHSLDHNSSSGGDDFEFEVQSPHQGPVEEAESRFVTQAVRAALGRLDEDKRSAIETEMYNAVLVQDVAAAQGVAYGTMKSRRWRGCAQMRRDLVQMGVA